MARHSPWRVGGPVEAWIVVHTAAGLAAAMDLCRERGWTRTVVGAASRLLFRDGGAGGAVMRLGGAFQRVMADDAGWWIGAGRPLATLPSLQGAPATWAGLSGCPGTLGASILVDPGWEPYVSRVAFVHRGGEREGDLDEVRTKAQTAVVTAVRLTAAGQGRPGPAEPHAWYSAGAGGEAATVLRASNLAGVRLREWMIPSQLPEGMVQLGGGSARDAALLCKSVIERVQREQGIPLTERLRWIGRAS